MIIAYISPFDFSEITDFNIPNMRPVPWTQNLVDYFSINHDVHLISGISPRTKNYKSYFINKGVHFHLFKTLGSYSSKINYKYEINKIRRIIHKIKPNIVHGQGVESFYGISAIYSGYPNIVTVHGVLNEIFKNVKSLNKRKVIELTTLNRALNVVSLNDYIIDVLTKYNIDIEAKNIFNIPNAVSPIFFKNYNKKEASTTPNILFSGEIRPRKGLMDLLLALKSIKDIPFFLNIIGMVSDSESKSYFKKCMAFCEEQFKDKYKIHGYVSHKLIPNHLLNNDMLVLPSYAETAPSVICEAQASSLAVLAYDIGGIKYMINDGENGILVPKGNVEILSKKIRSLLRDSNLMSKLQKNGKKFAENNYHIDSVGRSTLKAYQFILDK